MANKPRENLIRKIIQDNYDPIHFEIFNDSANHLNHLGQHDGLDHESHFKIVVVSEKFKGVSRVDRQRQIHSLLKDEMLSGALHSLSMKLYSTEEW
jgi:BolA family transcriptional regulator, general stress-responsive regulator